MGEVIAERGDVGPRVHNDAVAIRATSIPHRRDIEISPSADADSLAIISELWQKCGEGVLECREHDDNPRLAAKRDPIDGRVHGAWVYLQKRNGMWVICHHPSVRQKWGLEDHIVHEMTDQHRWQQDYWQRAGDDAGYTTDQEVRLPSGNRLDVAITGPDGLVVGVEVQHSTLTERQVLGRDKKAGNVGVPLVWSADRPHNAWAYKVTHVETQELPRSRTPRNSWTVIGGPRKMRVEKCRPLNFDACPTPGRRGRHCGGWHPRWEPYPGLTVDRVAELAPVRQLLRVDAHSRQGIVMLDAVDHRKYVDELEPLLVGGPRHQDNRGTSAPCAYGVDPSLIPEPRVAGRCERCDRPGVPGGLGSDRLINGRCVRCAYPAGGAPD
ncbi:hypothetical protein PHK61_18650 [Actinomycetospora lutea]|uniref:hypothetical protein n=1 Tax=Actinomycetospora lutea TaxID=663604 RepID=UPI0023670E76|nr:hypothetical protein [Actinomycetospora lutea]MDD7940448.1 hypothetical protein [Actinomycetospora lutea]